jgi:hypothetical protein
MGVPNLWSKISKEPTSKFEESFKKHWKKLSPWMQRPLYGRRGSCGKCPLCSAGITRRHLTKPKEKIKFNLDPDTFSLIPNEYLFVVGRHTGGKTMDTSHRLRFELLQIVSLLLFHS